MIYSDGKEVVTNKPSGSASLEDGLSIYGTFGPFLRYTARVALDLPGNLTWSGWEQSDSGPLAVFRFVVPLEKTRDYRVSGCCLPGTGESYSILPANHGEIVVEPTSGAIRRVQVQAELPGFVPTNRSEVMVTYGPVKIGNKTYIVPIRAVAVHRVRSTLSLGQEDWNTSFETWGPYNTQVYEFTFDHYHLFQGEIHILLGFKPVTDENPSKLPSLETPKP